MIKLKKEDIERVASVYDISYSEAEDKIIKVMKSISFDSPRQVIKTIVRMARDAKP